MQAFIILVQAQCLGSRASEHQRGIMIKQGADVRVLGQAVGKSAGHDLLGEAAEVIRRLVEDGGIALDPFASGLGAQFRLREIAILAFHDSPPGSCRASLRNQGSTMGVLAPKKLPAQGATPALGATTVIVSVISARMLSSGLRIAAVTVVLPRVIPFTTPLLTDFVPACGSKGLLT